MVWDLGVKVKKRDGDSSSSILAFGEHGRRARCKNTKVKIMAALRVSVHKDVDEHCHSKLLHVGRRSTNQCIYTLTYSLLVT